MSVLDTVRHLLRPIRTQLANLVARAEVQLVDDAPGLQDLQLGVLAGETVDDGERFQEYGFTSVPLPGAEAVVVFPNGDRGVPLVIAVDDRRHRVTGLKPGEVAIYNNAGGLVKLTKDGDIVARAAPGREVLVDDGSGTTEPVITKSQFDAHVHPTGTGPSGVPNNTATSGTTVLKAK